MNVVFLILATLAATEGATDRNKIDSEVLRTPRSHSTNKYEISQLPGYKGPLPSRHFSGRPTSSSKLSYCAIGIET